MRELIDVLHVGIAMLFVAGLIGRSAAFSRARRAQSIQTVESLLQLSDWFERSLVIPMYVGVLITGPLVAWIGGWPLAAGLQTGAPKWPLVALILFLSPILAIATYLIPRRKARLRALADAVARKQVTPELAAALSDRGVRLIRQGELVMTGVVMVLMVAKPF